MKHLYFNEIQLMFWLVTSVWCVEKDFKIIIFHYLELPRRNLGYNRINNLCNQFELVSKKQHSYKTQSMEVIIKCVSYYNRDKKKKKNRFTL